MKKKLCSFCRELNSAAFGTNITSIVQKLEELSLFPQILLSPLICNSYSVKYTKKCITIN